MLAHLRGDDSLLDHGAVGGQVAEEDSQPAGGGVGYIEGIDDRIVAHPGRADVLGQRAPGHGEHAGVQQAAFHQAEHHRRDAAGAVQVLDVMSPGRRAHTAQVRRAVAVVVQFSQGDLDAGLVGDGQQVQHRVGGTAQGHVHGEGVAEGGGGEDVQWPDIAGQKLHDLHAGLFGQRDAAGVNGGDRSVAGQAQAQRFGEAVHGVGGEHAGAGAAAGAGHPLQPIQIGFGHLAPADRAHGHEDVGQVHGPTVQAAGQHGPAADDDGRQVEPGGSHQHTGDDLVAVGDEHQGVEGVGLGDDLHRIGDELAAGQGVLHARVVHGQPVADADGIALEGRATGHADAGFDRVGDLAQPDVAGDRFVIRVDHADEGLVYFPVGTAQRPQQRAVRRPFHASFDDVAFHQ